MNEYCKNYLKHSWGSSPERKKLEKQYNADYYAANKNRWVINRQKRTLEKTQSSSGTAGLYENYADFMNSSKELVKNLSELPARIAKTPSEFISKVNKIFNSLSVTKAAKESMNEYNKATTNTTEKKKNKKSSINVLQLFKDALNAYKEI